MYPEVMTSIFIAAAIIIIVPRLRGAGELCRNKAPPALNLQYKKTNALFKEIRDEVL